MDTGVALTRMISYQTRILANIDAALVSLHGDPATAPGEMARARWEMTRLLGEYQLFKHNEIFDAVMNHGSPDRAALARDMKARCIATDERFKEHVRTWSARGVADNWADYKVAVLQLADALRAHIGRERADVERLLAGLPRTRARDAAPFP